MVEAKLYEKHDVTAVGLTATTWLTASGLRNEYNTPSTTERHLSASTQKKNNIYHILPSSIPAVFPRFAGLPRLKPLHLHAWDSRRP